MYTPSPSVFPTLASCRTGDGTPVGVAAASAVAVASMSGVGVDVGVPVAGGLRRPGARAFYDVEVGIGAAANYPIVSKVKGASHPYRQKHRQQEYDYVSQVVGLIVRVVG